MRYLLITLFTLSISFAQPAAAGLNSLAAKSVVFIDSVRVSKEDFAKFGAKDIATVSVYKDQKAIELVGDEGKNGVLYIESRTFCKNRYIKYFSSKSAEFKQRIQSPESDKNVQYILNNRVLTISFEGDLAAINDTNFKSIQLLSKEELMEKYHIKDKDFGFLILSDMPKNMYRGNKRQ